MTKNKKAERRKKSNFSDRQAYKARSLKRAIKRERRADNLERLIEIQEQRKIYFLVLGLCIILNLFLLTLGFIGLGN